ncbi:MAG: SprT-like domain-containing protein [Pseudomonadota bacterium]
MNDLETAAHADKVFLSGRRNNFLPDELRVSWASETVNGQPIGKVAPYDWRAPKNFEDVLNSLYAAFNFALFDDRLPQCDLQLGTLLAARGQASRLGAGGYRIIIDREYVQNQLLEKVLSTLVHEMCHIENFVFSPGMRDPHGPDWKAAIDRVGLSPLVITPVRVTHEFESTSIFYSVMRDICFPPDPNNSISADQARANIRREKADIAKALEDTANWANVKAISAWKWHNFARKEFVHSRYIDFIAIVIWAYLYHWLAQGVLWLFSHFVYRIGSDQMIGMYAAGVFFLVIYLGVRFRGKRRKYLETHEAEIRKEHGAPQMEPYSFRAFAGFGFVGNKHRFLEMGGDIILQDPAIPMRVSKAYNAGSF